METVISELNSLARQLGITLPDAGIYFDPDCMSNLESQAYLLICLQHMRQAIATGQSFTVIECIG